MHMAILALSAGVPVVPIAYEFKTSELFERLGMGHWVTAIGDVDEVAFPFKVQCFVEALPTFRSRLFQAVERERVLALNAAPLLKTAAEGLKRQWSVTRRRRAHA
jgi:colanic acid/amylovoran biosynthesis protein